ncbi:hypothetical protein BV20DRAFT_1054740 [Pilatotrama ljubarskyi]|nr:hypothetical protein BV20DRAFT_1054740 [Pilatotrama ljubarskyi]
MEDSVAPSCKRKLLPIPVGKMGPDSVLQPPTLYTIMTAREQAKREQLSFDENTLALHRSFDAVTLSLVLRGSPEVHHNEEWEWEEIMQALVQFMH